MGCFSSKQRPLAPPGATSAEAAPAAKASTQHAWGVLYAYFEMKHGREFADAPSRRLTQSFGLDAGVGSQSVTSRQVASYQ